MKKGKKMKTNILSIFCVVLISAAGCTTANQVAMEPATVILRDVFTCKGLTADNRWVGVTDEFLPEDDTRVVVVAQFDDSDKERVIQYELVNPLNNIAFTETKKYPKQNPLGVYFELTDLMNNGGEGKWTANVFADGMPIGQSVFYVGEKREADLDGDGPQYFIVEDALLDDDADDLAVLSEEETISTFIQEVTPKTTIPSSPSIQTVTPSPASPSSR
jgi:hypothetical protein